MDKVTSLRAHTRMTVDEALNTAKLENLQDAVVIGYDAEGKLFFTASEMDNKAALYLIEDYKHQLFKEE